jgi:hypothetical protein
VFGRAIYGCPPRSAAKRSAPTDAGWARSSWTSLPRHLDATRLASVTRIVRDGRKDNTALILGSHDPVSDYPAGTALDLIDPHRDASP